jgi:hypothetical protein
MRRISSIRSFEEAELERRLEELRNLRWNRHRGQLILGMAVIVVLKVAAAAGPPAALHMLLQLAHI